ncbi:MAG: CagA exotoxin [Idiomarinaceae bacterium HL-53]|nr:MAG: CagA exotoxin [Idiomarinaceae bacterium HL-53]CUS49067.1 hypothetical protein Ga0003345_2054 [Idiomarinaceae bacterium HL-53]
MSSQLHHLNATIDDLMTAYDYDYKALAREYSEQPEALEDLLRAMDDLQQVVDAAKTTFSFETICRPL